MYVHNNSRTTGLVSIKSSKNHQNCLTETEFEDEQDWSTVSRAKILFWHPQCSFYAKEQLSFTVYTVQNYCEVVYENS